MPEPTQPPPKPGEPASADLEIGHFSKENPVDEVLIPVKPGTTPKIADRVPDKIDNKKIYIMVVIVLAIAAASYFSYLGWQQYGSEGDLPVSSTPVNTQVDTDNDGLTDQQESELGTDPANWDTDQDGYSDGQEVDNGYDPLNKPVS